jgi:hypothetical protein
VKKKTNTEKKKEEKTADECWWPDVLTGLKEVVFSS